MIKRMDSTCRHIQGFSLIELLVAFSITTLTLTALFHVYSRGNQTLATGEAYAQAYSIAESVMAEYQAFGAPLADASYLPYKTQISSELAAISVNDKAPAIALKKLTVTVSWQNGQRNRQIQVQRWLPVL